MGLLLAGAVAPSIPQWASQDFTLVMQQFGFVFPQRRCSKPSSTQAGWERRSCRVGCLGGPGWGGDAVQGLNARRLQVPVTQAVLLWDFLIHPGVPVLDIGTLVLGSH